MWGWDHMGYGGWGVGWFFMVLFWVVLIVGIVALMRWLAGASASRGTKNAMEILEERYARGEIGRDEFEQKRKDLGG